MTEVPRTELAPGYAIARIINGCWQLTPDHGGGPGSERAVLDTFAELVDHGFTTFDCADIYTGVEALIGRFRRTLPDPDRIQVHTKYAADRDALARLTDADVDRAVDRSLLRLGVDRLDLLQFHWWNYDVPGIERMTDRLRRAQEAGKIRLLGVTNFDTDHVRAMLDDGVPLVSMQAQYSVLDRRPEREFLGLARDRGVRLLAYGALAGGFLSDRWRGQPAPATMNRSLQKYRLMIDEAGGWEVFQALLETLADIGRRLGVSAAAVAARWVLDRDGVAAVILGTGRKSRAAENLKLATLALEPEDRRRIRSHLEQMPIPPGDLYELERDIGGRHASIIKMNLHDQATPQ